MNESSPSRRFNRQDGFGMIWIRWLAESFCGLNVCESRSSSNPCGSKNTILKYADWIGWKASANWTFQNPFVRKDLKFVVPERIHETFKDDEELSHNLREAWRHHLFTKWKNTSRIDATFCPQTQFSTERCKLARKIALTSGNHFAIMTGSYISPMRIIHNERLMHPSKRRYKDDLSICPSCQQPADLDHWNWQCPEQASNIHTCGGIPRDPLQRRLGWPIGHFNDDKIISGCSIHNNLCTSLIRTSYHRYISQYQ